MKGPGSVRLGAPVLAALVWLAAGAAGAQTDDEVATPAADVEEVASAAETMPRRWPGDADRPIRDFDPSGIAGDAAPTLPIATAPHTHPFWELVAAGAIAFGVAYVAGTALTIEFGRMGCYEVGDPSPPGDSVPCSMLWRGALPLVHALAGGYAGVYFGAPAGAIEAAGLLLVLVGALVQRPDPVGHAVPFASFDLGPDGSLGTLELGVSASF